MKKIVLLTAFLLSISCLLCGCLPGIMFIPDEDTIGQAKNLKKMNFPFYLPTNSRKNKANWGLMHTSWQIFAE